jgi:CRP/FNR family transcriptional regulator
MTASSTVSADQTDGMITLLNHPALGLIDRADLEQLARSARSQALAPRERLFMTGDKSNAIVIVMSGWIKLVRTGANGRDIVLELAGAGSVFGELAAITGMPRGANAVALAPTRVLSINGAALVQALRRSPDALLELTRIVCERLRRANAQLEDILSVSAEVRLARALIRLAALKGSPSKDGLLVDLNLSQKELGEVTGLSREGTNKQLALWRDAGLIKHEGRLIALVDHRAMQRIADLF